MSEPQAIEKDRRVVADGVIRHFSVTKLQRFNEAEEGCELRWWYSEVQGRKEPERTWHQTGNSVDAQVEHYLLFGENVLGASARVGQHLLPAPGRDLLLQWGLNDQPRPRDETGKPKNYYPVEQSKVTVAGIPFIGFADCINGREEYLVPTDEYGEHVELRKEPGVIEVLDIKTAKSLRYTKKHEELFQSTQMNGYGEFVGQIIPEATHARLSHVTFTTEVPFKAVKRSVLVEMSAVRARWRTVVERVAERAKVVAAAKNEREVEGNLEACRSFGGCPHQGYCWKYKSTNGMKRIKMGLLKNRQTPAPTNGAPPVANGTNTPWTGQPVSTATQAVQLPAQNFQPPAQALQPPPQAAPQIATPAPAQTPQLPPGWLFAKDAVQGEAYVVNNVLTMYLSSSNGRQSFMPIVNGQLSGTPMLIDYGAFVCHAPGQSPQQAPQPQPQVQREPTAPPAPAPLAAQVQVPSFAPGAPTAAPTFAPGPQTAAAPAAEAPKRARRTKAEMEAARAAEAAGQPAPAALPRNGQGISLFVNAIPNDPFTDLASYVAEATQALQDQFGVIDIRMASGESPIGFGKWKGALAQVVKQDPPPAGTYVAFTRGNELTEVVVEALAPLCGPGQLIRGI